MRDMQIRRGRTFGGERPDVKIGRSQFNRSHGRKMTFDASYLYPIYVDEVLPGDTFTMKVSGFARVFSPLEAPIMDNITLDTFFFFVPYRLVWSNWVYFMGEHDDAGTQDTTYTIPKINTGLTVDHDNVYTGHGLAAFMGLPDGLTSASVTVSALPFRAYNLVYNQWFRDQNLIDEKTTSVTSNGPDAIGNYALLKSAKKHDYFTSALPYLQKGTAQTVALTGTADVLTDVAIATEVTVFSTDDNLNHELSGDTTNVQVDALTGTGQKLYIDFDNTDVTQTAAVDINALRLSVSIQRFLETDARSGTRYVEKIKSHFGVTSPDYRLQRSEYLGGGTSYINVSAIAASTGTLSATSPESADQYLGELRGVGTGTVQGGFAKSFTEHGILLGLMRARGDLTYQQGVPRMWSRSTLYDFYFPAFANLGEQAIYNRELFVKNDGATTDDLVFGYQERWAEYRFAQSSLVGLFNSDCTGSIDYWHVAEDFSDTPTLNATFIEDQTPMSRVTTFDTGPDFMADLWFDLKCARPIPVYSIPSLIGTRF